jgi:hypothetical protein
VFVCVCVCMGWGGICVWMCFVFVMCLHFGSIHGAFPSSTDLFFDAAHPPTYKHIHGCMNQGGGGVQAGGGGRFHASWLGGG